MGPTHPLSKLCIAVVMAALPLASHAGTVTTLFAIPGHNDGGTPNSPLAKLNGQYYGTTAQGGPFGANGSGGYGIVYKLDLKTGAETVVYAFANTGDGAYPQGGLAALNGKLYGVTYTGAATGGGVVFSLDPATGIQTVVCAVPNGALGASRLTVHKGLLYGQTSDYGAADIISVDPVAGTGQIVSSLPAGVGLLGTLIEDDGFLYGTIALGGTLQRGALFRFNFVTNRVAVVHDFGKDADGRYINGDLANVGGVLYGTTFEGGTSNKGTIFAFDPKTRQEAIVQDFSGADNSKPMDGILAYNGLLYGAALDHTGQLENLYAFNPANAGLSVVATLAQTGETGPVLTEAGGLLYGVQPQGGPTSMGLIFSADPTTAVVTTLHAFSGQQGYGASALTTTGGALIGTSTAGGAFGFGSIYKVYPRTGSGETLFSFRGADGASPTAPVVEVGDTLYGTTNLGGPANDGTVFSFTQKNHVMTTLAAFDGINSGAAPAGPLANIGNQLFGTTTSGGNGGSGTIFQIDPASGQVTTFATLLPATGSGPTGLIAVGNLLYGTATSGGTFGSGTIFSADPSTKTVTALYAFKGGEDGSNPAAPLLYSNGLLYGSTKGSPRLPATVFVFDPATNTKTLLHKEGRDYVWISALIDWAGKLYGTFPYDPPLGAPYGGVLRINPANGGTLVTAFSAGISAHPGSPLTLSNGALFGTTSSNTTANAGTVFKYVR